VEQNDANREPFLPARGISTKQNGSLSEHSKEIFYEGSLVSHYLSALVISLLKVSTRSKFLQVKAYFCDRFVEVLNHLSARWLANQH
jgi:hypothetical protein